MRYKEGMFLFDSEAPRNPVVGNLMELPEGCPKDDNVVLGKNNLLIFAQNGNVYVKGRLVANDEEIVNGMRELLRSVMSQ